MDITALVKEISNAGIGIGSLIIFAALFYQQMQILNKFKDSLDANTRSTDALTMKIEQSMGVDKDVLGTLSACKFRQVK